MKKIYFACSIAGGRDHAHLYQDIVDIIKSSGGDVLGELFANPKLVSEIGTDPNITPNYIWRRDCEWVKEADSIITEATQPSLGVGYEIAMAEQLKKPILALFNTDSGRRLSPMISGNPAIKVVQYSDVAETKTAIADFIGLS